MVAVSGFLAMGGYAGFVWPAFGLAAVVMAGLVLVSLRELRAREAEDQLALVQLIRDEAIAEIATAPASVRLLWDVLCLPGLAAC